MKLNKKQTGNREAPARATSLPPPTLPPAPPPPAHPTPPCTGPSPRRGCPAAGTRSAQPECLHRMAAGTPGALLQRHRARAPDRRGQHAAAAVVPSPPVAWHCAGRQGTCRLAQQREGKEADSVEDQRLLAPPQVEGGRHGGQHPDGGRKEDGPHALQGAERAWQRTGTGKFTPESGECLLNHQRTREALAQQCVHACVQGWTVPTGLAVLPATFPTAAGFARTAATPLASRCGAQS